LVWGLTARDGVEFDVVLAVGHHRELVAPVKDGTAAWEVVGGGGRWWEVVGGGRRWDDE
jgi:hypothetical protein